MRISFKIVVFCFASLVCLSCDRVTKDLAKEHLKNQTPISYFHDAIRLEYVENTGAARIFVLQRESYRAAAILPG